MTHHYPLHRWRYDDQYSSRLVHGTILMRYSPEVAFRVQWGVADWCIPRSRPQGWQMAQVVDRVWLAIALPCKTAARRELRWWPR